jgi:hypothetical protein
LTAERWRTIVRARSALLVVCGQVSAGGVRLYAGVWRQFFCRDTCLSAEVRRRCLVYSCPPAKILRFRVGCSISAVAAGR